MRNALKKVALAACLLAPLSCAAVSTADRAGSAGSAGAGTTTTSTTSTTSTASSSSGSASCTLPDPTGKAYLGEINIGIGPNFDPPSEHLSYIAGWFYDAKTPAAPACTGTMMGSCCYDPSPPANSSLALTTAGTVQLRDGAQILATLAPAADGTVYVDSSTSKTLTWAPGDTLDVVASGGTVDAFSVHVTAPALMTSDSYFTTQDISVSSDWTVSWTPSGDACATVDLLVDASIYGDGPFILCSVPDATGAITVPSSFLAGFITKGEVGTAMRRSRRAGVLTPNAAITVMTSDRVFGRVTLLP